MQLIKSRARSRRTTAAGVLAGPGVASMDAAAMAGPPAAAADSNIVVNGDVDNGATAPWKGRVNAQLPVSDGAATAMIKYETGPVTRQFFITSDTGSTHTSPAGANAAKGTWSTIMSSTFTTGAAVPSTVDIVLDTSRAGSTTVAAAPSDHIMDLKVDDVSIVEQRNTAFDAVGKLPGSGNPLVSHTFGADPDAVGHHGRLCVCMTNEGQEWFPDADDVSSTNTFAKINQINVSGSDDLMNWGDEGAINITGPHGVATWAGSSWAPGVAGTVVNGKEQSFLHIANSGGSTGVIDGPRMFEAAHVIERDGIDHHSSSTDITAATVPTGYPGTGVAAYLVSNSPGSPWTPAQLAALNSGPVFQNPSTFFRMGGNHHQSFFEPGGRYDLAYDGQTLNLAPVNGNTANVKGFRSALLNAVTFDAGGTMNLARGNDHHTYQPASGDAVNLAVEQVEAGDWAAPGGHHDRACPATIDGQPMSVTRDFAYPAISCS